jgi:hypothetical protein
LGLDDEPLSRSGPAAGPNPAPPSPPAAESGSPPAAKKLLRDKSAGIFSPRQKKLLLILSVLAAFLIIGTLLMFLNQGDGPMIALETVVRPSEAPVSEGTPDGHTAEAAETEPPNVLNLIFAQEHTTHHYFENASAGQILVIAGRIVNGYNERISQVRVKAALINSSNTVVAERQVFAGNYLNEEELKTLPMKEILARLALKGGQNGANLNIAPEKAVPFMLVFDKLPADLAEYRIEPVSFVPASDALTGVQSGS